LLAVAVLAAAAAVLPGSSGGQAPIGDSAVGEGRVLLTDFRGSVTAGPNGENPIGTLTLRGYLDFTATVTCVRISGNAIVGGHRIDDGPRAGQGFIQSSLDNGPPVDGRPVDDTIYTGLLPAPPTTCPAPGDPPPADMSSTGGGPFLRGDLTVFDAPDGSPAPPPPTRIERMHIALKEFRTSSALTLRARVCGRRGIAVLLLRQRETRTGPKGTLRIATARRLERPQHRRCQTHRMYWRLPDRFDGGRRYRVDLRARTTGRVWSTTPARATAG
jgi:hypothetical protein